MTVTKPFVFELHPGDVVVARQLGPDTFQVLGQSTNDLEAQRLIGDHANKGQTILVFRVAGVA